MPLPAPLDWEDEITQAALTTFNGVVTVKWPDVLGEYNEDDDSRGETTIGEVLLQSRPARIQHIGAPREMNHPASWDTEQRIRIQVELRDDDPAIPKGVQVVIEDGGRDVTLQDLDLRVIKAINSSHAALRTIEATTEGRP